MNPPDDDKKTDGLGDFAPDLGGLFGRAWAMLDASTKLVGNVLGRVDRIVHDVTRDSRAVAAESVALYRSAARKAAFVRDSVRATPRFARILSEAVALLARYKTFQARAPYLTPEQAAARLDALHASAARRVHDLAVELGGGVLKLGQFLSSRMDLLPPVWVEELSRLQDRVPPEPPEAIAALLEADLGAPVTEVFETFDVDPVAAASLAQVHSATLKDGAGRVAVKVQRPGIADVLEVDINALEVVGHLLAEAIPAIDMGAVSRELSRTLAEELDFELEARHLQAFGEVLAGRTDRVVPTVHEELSTDRVLVMDFIEGARIRDWLDAASPEQQARLLTIVVDTFARQILVDGLVHADPHPGNFLVRATEDGSPQLVLLDLGCVRRLDATTRRAYAELVGAILGAQPERIAELLLQMGFHTPNDDPAPLIEAAEAMLASLRESAGSLADIDPRREAQRVLEAFQNLPRVEVPEHFISVGRVLTSLGGIMLHYKPDIDLFKAVAPSLGEALRG